MILSGEQTHNCSELSIIKTKLNLLQVNCIFDIMLKFVKICDKIKNADIPRGIRQDFTRGVKHRRLCPSFIFTGYF